MTHYTLHVPVQGKDNVKRYPRVGLKHFLAWLRLHALPPGRPRTRMQSHPTSLKPKSAEMFQNHNSETGKVYYNIQLDFPVGTTELLAFPPKERDAQVAEGEPPGEEKAA